MSSDISHNTRRFYEKLAGFMFLFIIITFIAGTMAYGSIAGDGDFAQRVKSIAASETAYRVTVTLQTFGYIMTVLLSFALCTILARYNPRLARLALFFRLVEVAISGIVLSYRFVRMDLYANEAYASAFTPEQHEALLNQAVMFYDGGFNIAGIFFGFGSTLFFYLLTKTRYVPAWIGVFGIVGSVAALLACMSSMILPQYPVIEVAGWVPSLLAEIFAGLWLIFVGGKNAQPYLKDENAA